MLNSIINKVNSVLHNQCHLHSQNVIYEKETIHNVPYKMHSTVYNIPIRHQKEPKIHNST